jgi:hypothetical protein
VESSYFRIEFAPLNSSATFRMMEPLRPSVTGILLSGVVDTPPTASIPPNARAKVGKTSAIVIDEAHSSEDGKTSAAMREVLGASAEDEDAGPDPEDAVIEALAKRLKAARRRCNQSKRF